MKKCSHFRNAGIVRAFGLAVLLAAVWLGGAQPARALLILDNMIFIGPKAGATVFKVKNTAERPEAYRLEWTQLKMNERGGKDKLAPGEVVPGLMPADPYMFVAPRRLMIMPDQLQHIRFMVRRPQNMPPGEYRAYVVFQPEEVPGTYDPNKPEATAPAARGASAAAMDMLSGYRIPVFFLSGETSLKVALVNPRFGTDAKGRPSLSFTLLREGNRSALGALDMGCTGTERPVSLGNGEVRIFTELNRRDMTYSLDPFPPGCGSLYVDYVPHGGDPDYNNGTPQRLAEIPLP